MCKHLPQPEYPKFFIDKLATERRFTIVQVVSPRALHTIDFTMVPGGVVSCKEQLESHDPESVNLLLNGFNFRYRKFKPVPKGTYLRYKGIARHIHQSVTYTLQ
jgi:hypothetical protein